MEGAILRKYGVSTTIDFRLFEVDGIDFRVDAVHASGDSAIMKNEGAEANTTNSFTDEGNGYSIVLTATEMQAARIVLYFIDQTGTKVWLDTSITIETYGNASAEHAFDLDAASVPQTADHTAGIADIPTVAEFNARTILAAAYFDPANDDVAVVTLVATTTANTDMRGTNSAATEAKQDIIDTNVDTLLARLIGTIASGTHNPATVAQLGALTDWLNGGRLDLILDIIAADTTTDIPGLIAALNDLSASQVNAQVDIALSDYDGPTRAEATSDKDAIITQGDAAWTTGGGGSAPTVEQITADMDANSTKLISILADVTGLNGDAMRGTNNAATSAKQDTMETTLNAIPTTAMRGTDNANIVVPPTVSQFNARTIVSANYATAANLAIVDGNVDSIKVKTDSLTFTITNVLDSNIQRINDVVLVGDGAGTPMDAA